jgi:hypothetical protein
MRCGRTAPVAESLPFAMDEIGTIGSDEGGFDGGFIAC